MKLNYFDLGLHKRANEIDIFLELCRKNNYSYKIYGFEAHLEYCKSLEKKYRHDKNITIINRAISNKNGIEKLYINEIYDGHGNSIFLTKSNIIKDKFITVKSILFSEWINENIPNFKNENNILKFNIEGAEWHLMNDLNDSGLLKYFKIYLGSHLDMKKVSELHDYVKDYENILKTNNIKVEKFVGSKNSNNCDLVSLIKEKFN